MQLSTIKGRIAPSQDAIVIYNHCDTGKPVSLYNRRYSGALIWRNTRDTLREKEICRLQTRCCSN